MKKKYLNSSIINKDKIIKNINGYNLELVTLNGRIYRSDKHTFDLLRKNPAFFGDFESATKYLSDGSYIKYYDTKKGDVLKIIRPSLNNSKEVALLRVSDPKPAIK